MAYNGWTNYETWNVKLWIDNEEGSYRYWQGVADELWEADPEGAECDLAGRLREEIRDAAMDGIKDQASMVADLLGSALDEVNWDEIAESMLSDRKAEAQRLARRETWTR